VASRIDKAIVSTSDDSRVMRKLDIRTAASS
jgi:hypothetical protein